MHSLIAIIKFLENDVKFTSPKEFENWEYKAITLMGMSGVGKTTLASKIPKGTWFHYSGDYRIGTKYLEEPILDNIKRYAMKDAFLADLLKSDSIYFCSNITVDNLAPISTFLGKIGNPELGGLSLQEFKHRQYQHREAEIAAMRDVAEFIAKAREIYGYRHFLNDAGGSICEIADTDAMDVLQRHTLILYIKTTPKFEEELCRRAEKNPKPLYYDERFLDEKLNEFMQMQNLARPEQIVPDMFVRWVFPQLVRYRLPRYRMIADRYGYSVDYRAIEKVRDDQDFLELICTTIDKSRTGFCSA